MPSRARRDQILEPSPGTQVRRREPKTEGACRGSARMRQPDASSMNLVGRAADLPRRLGESRADNESRREVCLRRGKLSAMASRGRLAFGVTVGAVVWGLVLVAAAFFVPVY